MSVMDKLINAMKFNDDEDYEDEEEYEDEDYYGDDKPSVQETKSTRPVPAASVSSEPEEDEVTAPAPKPRKRFGSTSSAIDRSESAATRQVKKQYSEAGMEVCIIKPTSVNDAREVTDTLLANSTVVLNLEGLDNRTSAPHFDGFLQGGIRRIGYVVPGDQVEVHLFPYPFKADMQRIGRFASDDGVSVV